MPTPEHNPQSIPLGKIPAGHRFCRESEREKLPADAKFANGGLDSVYHGSSMPTNVWNKYTYITATPLPEGERGIATDDEHHRLAREAGQKFVMSHFEKEASPWIPLSERVPSESDFPVFLYADAGLWSAFTQVRLCHYQPSMAALEFKGATHWQPAATKLPAPPPAPAKTQREKDEERFHYIWERCECSGTVSRFSGRTLFLSALETERAHFGGRSAEEVARVMETIVNKWDINGVFNHLENLQTLRALLSPPKEGETKHE